MMIAKSKVVLILFILILMFCKFSYSQSTADFPDSNYFYNETRYERGSDLTDYDVIEYSIYYKRDSILNNYKYQLLGLKFTINYHNPIAPNTNGDIEFVLLRNDKTNKKVYIKGTNNNLRFNLSYDTTERLLYDFDLSVGDIYTANANLFYNFDSIKVISIDTIIDVNNIKRAVFTLWPIGNSPVIGNGYVIEGIGGLNGLLGYPFYAMSNIYQENFNCFNINNTSYQANFAGVASSINIIPNSCILHMFSGINPASSRTLKLFPSLSSDYINIEHDFSSMDFSIYNIYGDLLHFKSQTVEGKTQIDIRNLDNGIYFINSISNNTHYSGKFIKQ